MSNIKNMREAKEQTRRALSWNELPNGEKYSECSTFRISPSHSSIKLTRAGQKYQGGTNYWESPDGLNDAILEVIVGDNSIIQRAIALVKEKEDKAVTLCQTFAEDLLKEIRTIKEK